LMSTFSTFYRPHVPDVDAIDPSGRENIADTAEEHRWRVYRTCERLNKTRRLAASDGDENPAPESTERIEEVIRALVDARSDLDVITGVVSALEDQQQHLALTHVPTAVAREFDRQAVVNMGLKKRQLRSISDGLSRGAAALRAKYCPATAGDRFESAAEHLGQRWRLGEYQRAGVNFEHDCFVVDVSFCVEERWEWLRRDSLGKGRFVVARDGGEGPCALLPDPRSGVPRVVRGLHAIDAELCRIRSERAWKLIATVLENEASGDETAGVHPDVLRAVLALSRGDLAASTGKRVCWDERMRYVETFARTELCATLFRTRALVALGGAMSWHCVPAIVRLTTPTRDMALLRQLCAWLTFASTWYEIGEAAEPAKAAVHGYITALSGSRHCVPARARIGDLELSVDRDYGMTSATNEPVGRFQLLEALAEGSGPDVALHVL
jgi:hypothetical protein